MSKSVAFLLSGLLIASVGACASSGGARTPDEFRVVTKAPLTVPPEYKLRPPEAGTSLPGEVDPEKADNPAAFGTAVGSKASASEKALVAAAGANAVSPIIRDQVDYEEMKAIRKSPTVSDRVLFWRKDKDAAAEPDNATGGAEITIEGGKGSPALKLPGT